jgi:hypothetical protein
VDSILEVLDVGVAGEESIGIGGVGELDLDHPALSVGSLVHIGRVLLKKQKISAPARRHRAENAKRTLRAVLTSTTSPAIGAYTSEAALTDSTAPNEFLALNCFLTSSPKKKKKKKKNKDVGQRGTRADLEGVLIPGRSTKTISPNWRAASEVMPMVPMLPWTRTHSWD